LAPLDGIRAFAVASVLLYHAGTSWVTGGLLGVDVFFVLSGFLITSLLCDEQVRTGTIALGRFWAGRARRLLPALVVLLIGVALYAHFYSASLDLGTLRGDALSTLAYVSNWHFIFSDQGYFALAASPSPLLHTWSLAVEEQYYLIWPLIALPVLRWRGARMLAWVAAGGAVLSATAMAAMHQGGVGVDRLYYGTDTRAQALLIGSFLGAIASRGSWRPFSEAWSSTPMGRGVGAALGLAGGGYLLFAWHAYGGQDSFLYTGGFLLVALAAAAVIAHVVSWPGSVLSRFLSLGALTFVGRISYGLYLYHWPLFLWIDHAHTGLAGVDLLLVRLGATTAVATASYYLIELPVRTRRFFANVRSLAALGVVVAITVAAVVVTTAEPTAVDAASHRFLPDSTSGPPVRMILFGDSIAFTVGYALALSGAQKADGIDFDGQARLGCGILLSQQDASHGMLGIPPPFCRIGAPASEQWPALWRTELDRFRPDVTVLLTGRWELTEQMIGGQWMHIGQPQFDTLLRDDLEQAVRIGTSTGALMILETPPCFDSGEQDNGQPWPEDTSLRLREFETALRQVAAEHPKTVTVGDLGSRMCPGGAFESVVDGVRIRSGDGIHVPSTPAAGQWMAGAIDPEVLRLGHLRQLGRNLTGGALATP
jgi:peptidoglycan/LPS O-acetylase OafA/YrhL